MWSNYLTVQSLPSRYITDFHFYLESHAIHLIAEADLENRLFQLVARFPLNFKMLSHKYAKCK
jgi:hypothetical protein